MLALNSRSTAILIIAIVYSVTLSASRIKSPGDEQFRCSDEKLTAAECEEDRRDAIAVKCITKEELKELKEYNGCPVCKKGKYKGWCPVGCFVRGTKLLVWDTLRNEQTWAPVEIVVANSSQYKIIALDRDATRSDLRFIQLPIKFTTVGPESKPLVVFTTRNQATLGLSSEHAVVLANGQLVTADKLKVGDSVISSDGSQDTIIHISRPITEDDVFNLSVETEFERSHLIIAEGLLVGDQFLQGAHAQNGTILN